jgi:hypothetical protein
MIQWKKVSQDKEIDPNEIPTADIISKSNQVGIEMGKLPKGTKLDYDSFLTIAHIIDEKKKKGERLEEMVGCTVAYIRGYCEGIAFNNKIREGDR